MKLSFNISTQTDSLCISANQHFKSASYLLDVMTDPSEKHSEEPNAAAWQKCFNTKLGFFEHLEQPENTLVRKNFSKFMSEFQPPTAVMSGTHQGTCTFPTSF